MELKSGEDVVMINFIPEGPSENGYQCCFICGAAGDEATEIREDGIHHNGKALLSMGGLVDTKEDAENVKRTFEYMRTLRNSPIKVSRNLIHSEPRGGKFKVKLSACYLHEGYLDRLGEEIQEAGNVFTQEILRLVLGVR